MSVTFPNVPIIQGVPPILRNATADYDAQNIIAAGDSGSAIETNSWGIFDKSGTPVLVPDSFVSMENGREFRISDYPIENGGFKSYNKVSTPFEVRMTLAKGGGVSDRQAFLDALDTIAASLDLYDVATPDHVYVGVNITRTSQSRTPQSGAGMATVEIMLQEVRQTVMVAYTTATSDTPPPLDTTSTAAAKPTASLAPATVKQPTAAATVNQGAVRAKPVTINGMTLYKLPNGKQLFYKGVAPASLGYTVVTR